MRIGSRLIVPIIAFQRLLESASCKLSEKADRPRIRELSSDQTTESAQVPSASTHP
jgi:hypothetical protein